MPADFMPRDYNGFDTFQRILLKNVQAKLGPWGIPAAAFNSLQALQTKWDAAHSKARNKPSRTSTDVLIRSKTRKTYEAALRQFIRQYLRFNMAVTSSQKVGMGLTVPDDVKTRSGKPTHAPRFHIVEIADRQHRLRFSDPKRPTSRSKPKGVRTVQVYRFIGEKQPAMKDYRFIGNANGRYFFSKFRMEQQGQKAWYRVRYENTRGATGPWSTERFAFVA